VQLQVEHSLKMATSLLRSTGLGLRRSCIAPQGPSGYCQPKVVGRRSFAALSVSTKSLLDDDRGSSDFGDRILGALPYLLPLLDALPNGGQEAVNSANRAVRAVCGSRLKNGVCSQAG
jgi:hypothetical protein